MSRQHNFDELTQLFLRLMSNLRKRRDSPENFYSDAKNDGALRKLCVDLFTVAEELKRHENSAEKGIIAPVNAAFKDEWGLYRRDWETAVSSASIYDHDPEFALIADEAFGDANFSSAYESGTENEIDTANKIGALFFIKQLRNARCELESNSDEGEFIEGLEKTLTNLLKKADFSLQSADIRADLAPVLLVPHSVANKVTPGARFSVYRFWNEARKAYILGASMASMAMARATLEMLLRDVHKAEGRSLENNIQFMKKNSRLPPDVMHRIQKVGDTILHGLMNTPSIPGRKATKNPELVALEILRDLKTLIET